MIGANVYSEALMALMRHETMFPRFDTRQVSEYRPAPNKVIASFKKQKKIWSIQVFIESSVDLGGKYVAQCNYTYPAV